MSEPVAQSHAQSQAKEKKRVLKRKAPASTEEVPPEGISETRPQENVGVMENISTLPALPTLQLGGQAGRPMELGGEANPPQPTAQSVLPAEMQQMVQTALSEIVGAASQEETAQALAAANESEQHEEQQQQQHQTDDDDHGSVHTSPGGTKSSHKRDGTFAPSHAYRKKARAPIGKVTLEPDVDKRRRLFNRHWKKILDEAARLHAATGASIVALVLPYTQYALPVGSYKKKEKPLVLPLHLTAALSQPLEKLENQILHASGLPEPHENFRSMSRHQLSSLISDRMKTYCKRHLGRGGVCWGDPTKKPDDFPGELWQPLKNLKDSAEPGGPTRKDKLVRILDWLESKLGKMTYHSSTSSYDTSPIASAAMPSASSSSMPNINSLSQQASPNKRVRTGGPGGAAFRQQHSAAFNSLAMAARNAAGGYEFDPSLMQAESAIHSTGAVLSGETADGKALFLQNLRANILQLEFLSNRADLRPPGLDDAMLEERLKSLREYLSQVETWPVPWEAAAQAHVSHMAASTGELATSDNSPDHNPEQQDEMDSAQDMAAVGVAAVAAAAHSHSQSQSHQSNQQQSSSEGVVSAPKPARRPPPAPQQAAAASSSSSSQAAPK
eukprot:gb/GEZN01004261.1/.p1 GENE.gb/GEZN01004261.1/~~gb/GEZN01004261.1/.p1  ORF type:complete len:614 (+),score=142.08 gb/GEZN01004261.1/:46-1887(+)